jgi:hypothetical protein
MQNLTTCRHGLPVDDEVPIADQCQQCDWCPVCESVQQYDGEVCAACGRVWGEDY